MAINIIPILSPNPYSPTDENLINPSIIESSFNPNTDYIEYVISTTNGSFQTIEYDYKNYSFPTNGTTVTSSVSSLNINPETDLTTRGYSSGEYNVYYNFYKNELSSSYNNQVYFIKSISSDRTEVVIRNINSTPELINEVNNFKLSLSSDISYFEDFYLNFGNNNVVVANNIAIDNTNLDILINLYNPLPNNVTTNTTLWVVTKIANSLAFNASFTPTVTPPVVVTFDIKGPNFNLNVKDKTNNSTDYVDYTTLFSNQLTSSLDQIKSLINEKGIEISIDYTDFSNFIHFSSAEQRLNNFYYKISQIESYTNDIAALNSLSTPSSSSISANILQDKITNIIKNFDGYEYYLYYESSSYAWPKSTSTLPYELYPIGSPQVTTWYSNITASAAEFDADNQDNLIYSIPEYIRDDNQNSPYNLFIELVGQHYDNIWVYYKDVTNRYNGDNRLDFGISKDLVAEALKSFGVKLYQNNFTTSDLYNAFTGFNTGSTGVNLSPTGSDLITNYITASYEASITPIDDVNKEIYKRIYHNLPYLAKTKGTIPGLRALINCFGIPDTVLRISEFGGRDRDTSTYDYFYDRFSYAFSGNSGSTDTSRAYPQIPWVPLLNSIETAGDGVGYVALQYVLEDYVYREGGGGGAPVSASLPNNIEFRFKTNGIPDNYNTQSLLIKTNTSYDSAVDDWNIGIFLNYTQPLTPQSPYYNGTGSSATDTPYQGNLYFVLNDTNTGNFQNCTPIQLPFFDGGWWSVMLQRDKPSFYGEGNTDTVTYTLYAANKLYDSEEGNTIGFIGSSSITIDGLIYPELNEAWNSYDISSPYDKYQSGVYLGGHYSGSNLAGNIYSLPIPFNGHLQEFRYYSLPLDVKTFEDYTMNPTSIEGLQLTGASSSFNILGFRAALGNELVEIPFTSSANNISDDQALYTSIHPSITASADLLITQSFINIGGDLATTSEYFILYPYNINANTPETFYSDQQEVYYFDQPIVGIKNRVTDKIQIVSSSLPTGSVLSQYTSIQQKYPSLSSEVPDINLLEVAFSPQNEINDDILSSLGYFNIGEYIGDPRQVSSSSTTYPDLVQLNNDFFKKYFTSYNLKDYVRLIKYFDNSLFKMIQDFVPARTSLTSGVVIKQHILERNKYPQPQVEWEELDYSGSIDTAFISGSTGGVFNPYNVTTFAQDWTQTYVSPVGELYISHSTQDEFYNGELPGTEYIVTDGELNPNNEFKLPTTLEIYYNPTLYLSNITPIQDFLNINTSPNQGEIYLWFDTGSTLQPAGGGGRQR